MAIVKAKTRTEKPHIDLRGPAGNAFVLMGYAGRLAKQRNLDKEAILAEMKSGDYENLVAVFDKHFGDYVDLWR